MSKSAKEMFEELGYKQSLGCTKSYLVFTNDKEEQTTIQFDLFGERIAVWRQRAACYGCLVHCITKQELQAINQMVKELGWLDEE